MVSVDAIRTQLARYESRLLSDLRDARSQCRLAERRVRELEVEVARVREALAVRSQETVKFS